MDMLRGLIGVVHLAPLPGDPAYERGGFDDVIERAICDARAIAEGGASAIVVENFGSAPFPKGTPDQPTPPEVVAAIARAALACKEASRLPIGINVLRNDVRSAIGIAAACGGAFVRVNVHVGAYITDQGLIEGRAFETLRHRRTIGAESIAIFADVRVKHAAPLAPQSIGSEVEDCLHRGRADALVVTGTATGKAAPRVLLEEVRAAARDAPVFIGSGLDPERAPELAPLAHGAIVGTWIKKDGRVQNEVDRERVRALVQATKDLWRR
jgi:uncharacterized protein